MVESESDGAVMLVQVRNASLDVKLLLEYDMFVLSSCRHRTALHLFHLFSISIIHGNCHERIDVLLPVLLASQSHTRSPHCHIAKRGKKEGVKNAKRGEKERVKNAKRGKKERAEERSLCEERGVNANREV